MDVRDLLLDLFARVAEHVHDVLDELGTADLTRTVEPETNPIGWLVWHLARIEDAQVAQILGIPQVWEADEWGSRFGVAPDPANHGYGHTPADVASVRPESTQALLDYFTAVNAVTLTMLQRVTPAELDRVVDDKWDPPVTMGVRLVSIADDQIQHAGQAAYLRGLLDRRR